MLAARMSPLPAVSDAELLRPTRFIESDAPTVRAFAEQAVAGVDDPDDEVQLGVALYYAVRDGIRYDPYRIALTERCYRATTVLEEGAAYCIPKGILLAAAARSLGIVSALGFADVRNHLNTEKLRALMGGKDLFIYHGYTWLRLAGQWLKVTPAFNLSLCERFGVLPLEFDGTADALMHPYDAQDRRHMEYVHDRGAFADLPFEELTRAFAEYYPNITGDAGDGPLFEDEQPSLA